MFKTFLIDRLETDMRDPPGHNIFAYVLRYKRRKRRASKPNHGENLESSKTLRQQTPTAVVRHFQLIFNN